MSLVVVINTVEGLVLASDSRASLSRTEKGEHGPERKFGLGVMDSNYKTLLAPHDIGIATYGEGGIEGKPIAGYIEAFVAERIGRERPALEAVARGLLEYFSALPKPPAAHFYVAGYQPTDGGLVQEVWNVGVADQAVNRVTAAQGQGAYWGGETDVLSRLLQKVALRVGRGYRALTHYDIPYNYFTLQEAIDFAVYAIKVTEDTMRFQLRPSTVGGPIDVLVIKPAGAFWVQRKALAVRS